MRSFPVSASSIPPAIPRDMCPSSLPLPTGWIVGGGAPVHLIYFQHPEWKYAGDHVPDQAIATPRKLLDWLATDRSKLIGFFHLPYPGVGIVERKDGAYRFVPAV